MARTRIVYPGPGYAVAASHAADCRGCIRVLGIRQVVAFGKRHGRDYRCVHVGGEAGHERHFVAEVAIGRAIVWIGDHRAVRAGYGTRVVHARNRHLRSVAGRVGRIDFPGREVQAVVNPPLVAVDAGHFVAGKVTHCDRQVRGAEFLAELRRERVELGSQVVGHRAGEMAGNMCWREDVELRQRRHLVGKSHFLAIAQGPRRTGEWCHLPGAREQAHVVRNHTHGTNAGPECFHAAGIAFMAREGGRTQIGGLILRVVRVVVGVHRCLVGQDEDVAQAGELLRDRRDVDVTHQDVLVLFLHQFESRRDDDLDYVLAGRQHLGAVAGRIIHACRTVGASGSARRRIDGCHAGELVHAVVRCRLYLVQHGPAVIALELGVIRQRFLRTGWIQELRAALQGREERTGRILAWTVHVGDTVGTEAL